MFIGQRHNLFRVTIFAYSRHKRKMQNGWKSRC